VADAANNPLFQIPVAIFLEESFGKAAGIPKPREERISMASEQEIKFTLASSKRMRKDQQLAFLANPE